MQDHFLTYSFKDKRYTLPCFQLRADTDNGAHVVVSGGMHGDEVNGIYHVRKFIRWLNENDIKKKMRGRITILPILNISGFHNKSRYVTEDEADLNRTFGLVPTKSYSYTLANVLVEQVFSKATIIVDIHDSGSNNILVPHTRIHISDAENCVSCSRELAYIFGLEVNLERKGVKNMLAVHMKSKFNIPVLTVEIGGGQKIHHEYDDLALQGLKNILAFSGIIDERVVKPEKQYFVKLRAYYALEEAAVFDFKIRPGQKVRKGEVVGDLYYPIKQEISPLVSPEDGIIFSMSENNQGSAGEVIFSVAR
ncbi:MAG: succinylglutamate desuccinylase/aspartoacylase family protein [Candidatus Dojkabacteria bacterium]